MATVRERVRSLRPETAIVGGAVLAFGGNCAYLVWIFVTTTPAEWPGPVLAASLGLALSMLAAFVLARRRARTAKHFGFLGLLASAIALLTLPGVIGGGVALVGAVWGILATYEGM